MWEWQQEVLSRQRLPSFLPSFFLRSHFAVEVVDRLQPQVQKTTHRVNESGQRNVALFLRFAASWQN